MGGDDPNHDLGPDDIEVGNLEALGDDSVDKDLLKDDDEPIDELDTTGRRNDQTGK
jgi:hypothetical protein